MLEGTTGDFHFYPFCIQGYYEWRNVAIAAALVPSGGTIVEIGANVGTETVCFADLVGASGRVHAIEPLPSNVAALLRAKDISHHGNISVHEIALSDRSGQVDFSVPPGHASGIGHIAGDGEGPSSESIRVQCATLDTLGSQIGPSQLIVMDVEGEEVRVLRGGRNYLASHKPPLVLEASPKLLARAGDSLSDLRQSLLDLGYGVFEISRFGLKPAEVAGQRGSRNWLCLSGDRERLAAKVRGSILQSALLPCLPGLNPLARV